MKHLSIAFAALALAFLASCGAKSDLEGGKNIFDAVSTDSVVGDEAINAPPEVECPPETYAAPTKPALLEGSATDDGWITEYLWEVTSGPAGSTAAPSPADSPTTSLTPDMAGTGDSPLTYTLRFTATDNTGLSASCTTTVLSVHGAPVAICPENQDAVSGATITLDGDAFDDGAVVRYLWEIVSGPPGYTSRLEDTDKKTARFISGAEDSGTFTVRFTVWDDTGLSDSCEMIVAVGGAPEAICPEDMTIPTRTTTTLEGNAEDDGTIVSWQWACTDYDTDTAPTLGSPAAQDTTFYALRVGHYTMQLTVTDDQGLSDSCTFVITTTETGPTAICPATIETTPLIEIELTGAGEDDGEIRRYDWELVSKPTGSSATPPTPSQGQTTRFMPDIAGEYTIRLTVTDDYGHTASCEFIVRALSGEGLRVEIYWNPPENPSDTSDVDLHLLHPSSPAWFDGQGDCYYSNCDSRFFNLEWDGPGNDDNPSLDLDDVDGYGPENINIYVPIISSSYTVGIHYYNADTMGAAEVYVKIYCGQISADPVYEAGPTTLYDHNMGMESNDFWKVATVQWNGYACSVVPINTIVIATEAMTSR